MSEVYFNQGMIEVKRVAGYILLVIAFLINIPVQAGIAVYGLVYAIRAFLDGNISTGTIAILLTAACVAIAHFAVRLVLTPLKGRAASLLSKTDVETTHFEQREWQRKQTERGYFDRRRSILDAEVDHIKDSLGGISSSDVTRNRQKRG